MKYTKIILALSLLLCLLLPVTVFAEEEQPTSGVCGEGTTWSFDPETGTLTFSGTGAILSTAELDYHWGFFYGEIIRVVFGEGITHVPEIAFSSHVSIKDITFLGDMPTFGDNCFRYLYCSVFYPVDNATWQGQLPENHGANEIYFQPFGNESTHCGNNATWTYDSETQTLTIGGSGPMYEYFDDARQPWYSFRDEVKHVIIGENITHIGRHAFSNMPSLEYIRCLGDRPTFSPDYVCNKWVFGYYPADNETWKGEKPNIGSQNGGTVWTYYVDTTGKCGKNTVWTFDPETGTLTISGTGKMDSYEQWECPWRDYNKEITKVVVKGTVEHIADWSFYRCFEVTEFVIEEGVTSIGRNGLQNTKISAIDLPDSIVSIGSTCFGSSHNLTKITLPANLKVLEAIFTDCPNLSKIYINKNLEAVETGGLCGLRSAEVFFTGDAPVFDEKAFNNSTAIVYYPANNPTWTDDVLQLYGGVYLIWAPYDPEKIDEVTRPLNGEADVLGEGWHFKAEGKQLIIHPDCDQQSRMQNIENYARVAKEVVFEDGVTYVAADFLSEIKTVESIILADTITTIGDGAFQSCWSLQTITLPKNLQFIGAAAFADCRRLNNIYFTGSQPEVVENAFTGVTANVYYPLEDTTWSTLVYQHLGGDLTWHDTEEEPTSPTEPAPTAPAPTEPAPTDPTTTDATEPDTPENTIILADQVITKDILESAKEQNQTIVLPADQCQWSIDPSTITESLPDSVDLGVKLNTDAIPQAAVETVAAHRHSLQLSLAHDGAFGFNATLTVPVGTTYAGQPATLYYWTPSEALEKVTDGTVNEDGTLDLDFSHASDYLLVIGEDQSLTPTSNRLPLAAAAVIVLAAVTTVLLLRKKKK